MTEALRIYVIAATGLVGIVGTPMLWKHWPSYKTENKFAWLALVLFNLAVFVGTIEVLVADLPGGVRNYFMSVAVTWLLFAVSVHPARALRSRWSRRPEEKP